MKPGTFFYNIGQGCKGVFRNSVMSTASVFVLIACMILVGTFYLIIDTIDINFRSISGLNVIEIMMDKNYTEDQIAYIGDRLEEIRQESAIVEDEVVYISPDEHLEIMREMYGENEWFNDITASDNPLRGSYQLTYVNLSDTDEVNRVKYRIESIAFEDGTKAISSDSIKDYITLYDNVMSVKNTMYIVGLWLMAILLIISLFIIMNTIKLGISARSNEITFMRLCGATKAFIRMPFIVEGIIIGVVSAIISFGLEFYLYEYLLRDIVTSSAGSLTGSGILMADFSQYAFYLAVAYLAIGLFAGIVSSSISLKKYLKA